MFTFEINHVLYSVQEDISLLTYLRDKLKLTSVKNGCSEGACGSCMILVNNVAIKSCLLTTAKIHNKKVLTIEGLSDYERDVYTWAFSVAGAVQCGYCTPGMIISAKALLDKNKNPNIIDIKKAISPNICRCTGYVKIIKAIELAAKAFKQEITINLESLKVIGENALRVDAKEKILGLAKYGDDLYADNMLYGGILRSKYIRAVVKNINVKEACKVNGVKAILTAKDIPGAKIWGYITKDWPVLVGEGQETHYAGDAIALVAAETKEALKEGLSKIQVDYKVLTPITTPEKALEPNAPNLHRNGNVLSQTQIRRGDAEKEIAKADFVVTEIFTTPFTEHAFMEPESALGVPDLSGGITMYVGSQSIYEDKEALMAILNLPEDKVRIIATFVGGAFGGKEDLSVQHYAALLALATKRPVKVTLSREESILTHPKRHAMAIYISLGGTKNGKITALKARIIADTGAYASLGAPVLQRACTHITGPYEIENIDVLGKAVYTNNPPAGAFRGFGVPQAAFALETALDLLAHKVDLSPWEIRYLNAIEPGKVLPTGQIADEGTAFKETLLAVKEAYENLSFTGIACALKNTGIGVGLKDVGRAKLLVKEGEIIILTSAACLGQGLLTVLIQILYETLGRTDIVIKVVKPDTLNTPNSGTTTASRQTLFTGEAVRLAAIKLKEALQTKELSMLEGQAFYGEYLGETDALGTVKDNPKFHVAYSYATHVVSLDEEGHVIKVIAAHDVGHAINPLLIEGQVEGAVVMGLGYALTEEIALKEGQIGAKYKQLGLFKSVDIPEIETIIIEKNPAVEAYGAKGIGEIAAIPIAAAVNSAYHKLDGKIRRSLPLRNTLYRKT